MKWNECNTIDELKLLGNFHAVKNLINKDLHKVVKVKAKSWNELINKIILMRKLFSETVSKDDFISEERRYLFCLLDLEGENRMKHLGITTMHYKDAKLAKRWRNTIAQKIHPDVCQDPRATLAMTALKRISQGMGI